MANIKSTDPRKQKIVAAFKQIFGCSKVTNLKESRGQYLAHCMIKHRGQRKFTSIGDRELPASAVGLGARRVGKKRVPRFTL